MNKKILSLVTLCIIFLAGCGRQYQVKPLKHVKKTDAQFIEKKENIELRIKKLNRPEINQLFDNRRVNNNVVALALSIKNSSSEPIHFGQTNTTLKLLSADKLFSLLKSEVTGKIVIGALAIPALFIASLFLSPVFAVPACCGGQVLVFLPLISANIFIGAPIIVGVTGSAASDAAQFNVHLSQDINRKVLATLTVAPGKKESALLFTKELPESFTITLLKGQEKVPFTITLKIPETPKTKRSKVKP